MNTLEILFVALPVVAFVAAIALFFSIIKKDKEYTITLNIESEEQDPVTPEPVAKPKRRYKRRKKKAPVATTVTPVAPAAPRKVGRPRKTT